MQTTESIAASVRKDRIYHRAHAKDYDQSITDRYRIYHRWDLEPWIASLASRRSNIRALDIGSGTGVVARALAAASINVTALDHAPEMLAIAGSGGGLKTGVADALRLPFAHDTFDVVTMQGILHHLPFALDQAIAEAVRVLRPGGEIYISEPVTDVSPAARLLTLGSRAWGGLRGALRQRRAAPAVAVPHQAADSEPDEAPLEWAKLAGLLDAARIEYRARFLTHVPSERFHRLPDRLRLAITLGLSFPWRRGDIVFVHGRLVAAKKTTGRSGLRLCVRPSGSHGVE